jgi:methanethiol S-methyltransferase
VHDPRRAATPTARAFAWSGAAAFVLSLGYFLYRYGTAFGVVMDGPVRPAAVVWNVLLFSGFAAHHSVFARQPVRQWLIGRFPHLERSIYVWIASVLFVVVCWLWQPVAGTAWSLDGPARALLVLLQVGGMTFSVYSASRLSIWELAGLAQLNSQLPAANRQRIPDSQRPRTANHQPPTDSPPPTDPPPPTAFDASGPYGLVRHPIYLGWFVLVFAVGTMTNTRLVFAAVSCVYVLIAIPFEERTLSASSQGAYERYRKRVPWRLVPRVY